MNLIIEILIALLTVGSTVTTVFMFEKREVDRGPGNEAFKQREIAGRKATVIMTAVFFALFEGLYRLLEYLIF